MEYLDGVTLRSLLRDGPLEISRAAALLEQIGTALAAAHRAEVLHRDLKPENVMLLDAGSAKERIKLIDFGIARVQVNQTRTHSTQLAGSPGYVAPERWVGLETYASDVYSLAAMAVEMLAGEPVTDLHFRESILECSRIPRSAVELIAAALAYDPEKRPSDPAAFARELSICLIGARR
jgi:serine/threonine-protein kinase